MRLVKVEDLRKEIEIISQNHEREVDRKDAIIQVHPACNRTRHGCSTEISRMTDYSPLTTHHSPLTTHHSPRTTHHAPRTTHHSPRTAHHSPDARPGSRGF
jgi:hypothetical protein